VWWLGSKSFSDTAYLNTLRPYVGASGIAGLVALYGLVPKSPDFAVSHWKYGGNDGEYSTHTRTKVYDSSFNALPAVACGANNKEPCYKVSRGQKVRVEFTTENLSGYPMDVGVEYRLSTNDTIPNDLTSGTFYWIGTIVNPGHSPAKLTRREQRDVRRDLRAVAVALTSPV
jgi:hypothetical protein